MRKSFVAVFSLGIIVLCAFGIWGIIQEQIKKTAIIK